jgi:hypothetical protein
MNDLSQSGLVPRRWMLTVWAAFLAACLLEVSVFAVVDPEQLHWPNFLAKTSRQTTYTLAFFCFWLISAACCSLALWLAIPAKDNT